MDENKSDIWFPAKKFGVGWGLPVAWQGWAVLASYMLLLIIGSLVLVSLPGRILFFPFYVILLTVLLIFICWKKGEKPELRWGNKK